MIRTDGKGQMTFQWNDILSMSEIMALLRRQAELRAPENDEGGILQQAADDINTKWLELDYERID